MEKIGILYICTGPYKVFWEDFYKTAEEYFLKDFEKHYYIFTDDLAHFDFVDKKYVHLKYIENLPWPLITLFRFRYFLSIKTELENMDYLMFSNSNMKFANVVTKDEFLPRKEQNEDIFVTVHPGYINSKNYDKPFDRSKTSLASVPYNCNAPYVIGAMNGGTSKAFLKMAEELNNRTVEDLKHNVIAKWHDESHLNKYVSTHNNCRVLSPSFCYPCGFELPYEKKIFAVSKESKFNIRNFKGTDVVVKNSRLKLKLSRLKMKLRVLKSCLFREKNVY